MTLVRYKLIKTILQNTTALNSSADAVNLVLNEPFLLDAKLQVKSKTGLDSDKRMIGALVYSY